MIKHFCDVCNQELRDNNTADGYTDGKSRLSSKSVQMNGEQLEITVCAAINGKYVGDERICSHCIIDAVARLDNRTRDAEAA